jgi:hypothetical protein
LFIALSY